MNPGDMQKMIARDMLRDYGRGTSTATVPALLSAASIVGARLSEYAPNKESLYPPPTPCRMEMPECDPGPCAFGVTTARLST